MKNFRKGIGLTMILCLLSIFLYGCWSKKELTEIAIVVGVGIDKNENGTYRVSVQVVNPINIISGQQLGGLTGPPITVYHGDGHTLLEAAREVTKEVSRQLHFDHCNLVVIQEDLAKEGIKEILDALERSPDFRSTALISIARGTKAQNIIKTVTPIDHVSAQKIIYGLENTQERLGENIAIELSQLINDVYHVGASPVLSGVEMIGNKAKAASEENAKFTIPLANIKISKLAVFKEDRLIDWIDGDKAKGIIMLRNRLKGTVVNLDWKEHKDAISVSIHRSNVKIKPSYKNGKPTFLIKGRFEGNISEVQVPIPLSDPAIIGEVENILSKKIKKMMEEALEYAKEKQTDLARLGEHFWLQYPKEYFQLREDWNEKILPEVDVDIKVKSILRRTDMKFEPFFIKD